MKKKTLIGRAREELFHHLRPGEKSPEVQSKQAIAKSNKNHSKKFLDDALAKVIHDFEQMLIAGNTPTNPVYMLTKRDETGKVSEIRLSRAELADYIKTTSLEIISIVKIS